MNLVTFQRVLKLFCDVHLVYYTNQCLWIWTQCKSIFVTLFFFLNCKGWQFSQAYLSWDKKWNGVTGLILILSCVCNNVVGSNWFFSSVGLSSIPGPWGQRVRSCFFSSLCNWNDENALKANSEYLSELLCLFLLSNAL